MRTELQAKFLQHLNQRNQSEKGFTLVELLVVIIIIGILAAIALPNFLNQSAKAKQTEAKQTIGISNRYQTLYRSENNTFADTFDQLAIGTLSGSTGNASTTAYSYTLSASTDNASLIATSRDNALKSYSGGNNIYANTSSKNVIAAVICEAINPGQTVLSTPTFTTSAAPVCPSLSIRLGN